MGKWSDYPDGCDSNIDIFGIFLNRYFAKQENPDLEMDYEDESEMDPGLGPRMQLRMGGSPNFGDEDLTDEAMERYLEILQMYDGNISDNEIVGLGISLARVINNEQFGLSVTELPTKNLLRKDVSDFIKRKALDCDIYCGFKDEKGNTNNEETLRKKIIDFFSA